MTVQTSLFLLRSLFPSFRPKCKGTSFKIPGEPPQVRLTCASRVRVSGCAMFALKVKASQRIMIRTFKTRA